MSRDTASGGASLRLVDGGAAGAGLGTPGPPTAPPRDLAGLARRAAEGDERAWHALVARLDGVLRSVVRGYRLAPTDAEDVVQTTWLRAISSLHRLREPGAIGAWLVMTARREALRSLQRGVRELLTDELEPFEAEDETRAEDVVIERERAAALRRAVARLSGRQRELVMHLLATPAPCYEELSERLGMPIGSIGPTRERALARLREDPDLARLLQP
jgi:RNA polymerase sigma factor (sigma-70 family)